MNQFAERFDQSIDMLHAQHGEVAGATYVLEGVSTVLAHAQISEEQQVDIEKPTLGIAVAFERHIKIVTDPAHPRFCGIETPVNRAQVIVNSVTYDVYNMHRNELLGTAELQLRRDALMEVSKRGIRIDQ